MTIRAYSSPEAFKQALEQHLRASAKTGAEFAPKRQLLVFDRFLARVVAVLGDYGGGHERIHFRLSGGSIHGCG